MDDEEARELLLAERTRVQQVLDETVAEGQEDRSAANEPGDMADSAEPLTSQEADEAVAEAMRARLGAITRAEQRLDSGTYGYSIRSGVAIPEERLRADPAAELTVEEAQEAP
jgi:DnaK suppressor protein